MIPNIDVQVREIEHKGLQQVQELKVDNTVREDFLERVADVVRDYLDKRKDYTGSPSSGILRFIPLDKESIPYRFDIKIAGKTYGFEIHYNEVADFFAIDLYDGEELLISGERLVYGSPLFRTYIGKEFPAAAIIPADVAGQETDLIWANMADTVFLFVVTEGELPDA